MGAAVGGEGIAVHAQRILGVSSAIRRCALSIRELNQLLSNAPSGRSYRGTFRQWINLNLSGGLHPFPNKLLRDSLASL